MGYPYLVGLYLYQYCFSLR